MNLFATALSPDMLRSSRAPRGVASVIARPGGVVLTPGEASSLIVRIAQYQDRQAFAVLFGYFFPRVKSYLMRVGAAPGPAEEIAQETMLRVWRKAGAFNPETGAASTWIFVIARNLRIDRLRGENQSGELDLDPSEAPDPPPTGETVAIVNERRENLTRALGALSSEQAEIIRLFYFEERPHSDISRVLDIPLGTVKSRVRLALEKLRLALEDVQ